MIPELSRIETLLSHIMHLHLSNTTKDEGAEAYSGYNFRLGPLNFKFRKAKITPKKKGQFVTLWKRNAQNITVPFAEIDEFDFYIIAAEENEKYGFFVFPRRELINRHILSTSSKDGKRGFRVYPSWTTTDNNQASTTQIWQKHYFIDFNKENKTNMERLKIVLTEK